MIPLKKKYNITPDISYSEAVARFELVIIEADFALEYPQPLLPCLRNVFILNILWSSKSNDPLYYQN